MTSRKTKLLKSRRVPHALFAAAALAVAACQPTLTEWTETESPKTIDVQRLAGALSVNLNADGSELAPGEAPRIDRFLSRQGNLFNLRVTLAAHNDAAVNRLGAVERFLVGRGVRPLHIARATEPVPGSGDIKIETEHYVAAPPACPDWTRANIIGPDNRNSSNFGCASASNLARMVADPRDLVVGRGVAPASGVNAAAGITRYNSDQVKPLPETLLRITTDQ